MNWALQLSVAPEATDEPILLADAKLQLRIDTTADDVAVARRISGARARAEAYLMRGLVTQVWIYAQDGWTDEIQLPMAAPLQNNPLEAGGSTAPVVQYYDTAGTLQTLATTYYTVDTISEPGCIRRAPNQSWPSLQADRQLAVKITYVVGYTSAASIPADIIDGIYLLLGDSQEFRQQTVMTGAGQTVTQLPNGAEACLAPHRRWFTPPTCGGA